MAPTSFKKQHRLPPSRFGTPPPPPVEPLSPVRDLPFLRDGNDIPTVQQHREGQDTPHVNGLHRVGFSHGHVRLGRPSAVLTSPLGANSARPGTAYSQAYGSPIDTLANAASSMAASPVSRHPSRRQSQVPISPTNVSHLTSPRGRYGDDHGYHPSERPAKRARSEYVPSPQHPLSASRPVTSHVPATQWAYNVEEMVNNGTRMYQESPMPGQAPDENTDKRLSEAQLLLDFTRTAFTTSISTHSQPPATNGWSSVYTARSDMPNPNGILVTDDVISHRQSYHHDASLKHGEHMFVQGSSRLPTLKDTCDESAVDSAVQTHTPPEDTFNAGGSLAIPHTSGHGEPKKTKSHQGWPKGKPRGPRTGSTSGKKRKASGKVKSSVSTPTAVAPDQLHSPQSLPASPPHLPLPEETRTFKGPPPSETRVAAHDRRHSVSDLARPDFIKGPTNTQPDRALSVPPNNNMTISASADFSKDVPAKESIIKPQLTICAGCNFTSSTALTGENQDWVSCDGCNGWFHFACAGFESPRVVRNVDKFFCRPCQPTHGKTTWVRKSARAHTTVDYAGLNEGVLRTSDETPEHHYIQKFKDSTFHFTRETFARMPPELVTMDYFEKMNGFHEPVVIPATLNPRPNIPGSSIKMANIAMQDAHLPSDDDLEHHDYESIPDDGQDKLDMVIPQGLTVRRVAEMYGLEERVEVIDVKSQGSEDKRWNMARWADYYEETGEKPVRNVISLEVSQSKLGRLIRRPKVVRDMDLQDSVWPEDDKANAPKVQFYCLMSVADCYTDFHIDFGGSSVYYHIVKGKKTFFFIPPTKQNLKQYEDWCMSPAQNWTFLAHQVKECYRVDLSEGDTMLIPAGWIHAVWTPENSLVIGGNFLTRLNYAMQIRVAEVEKATKVARKFRYPNFQKVLWLAMLKYLDEDPLPQFVAHLLSDGKQFERQVPVYCEPDSFGHNSRLGTQWYNARYYSKAELDGLPDLASYIFRTVMISLGKIEGVTQEVRNAVKRSIPKGKGDALELVKKFAMWAAWKRGNENIPQWAHPEALLPEAGQPKSEIKLSAAALKKLERKSWSEAFRASRDRPTRQIPPMADTTSVNGVAPSNPLTATSDGPQRPITENGRHLSTPKTSQLGPKRIACDACRKRRIRCKHKDALTESQKATAASSPLLVHPPLNGSSSLSGAGASSGRTIKLLPSDIEPVLPVLQTLPKAGSLISVENGATSLDFSLEALNSKSGRVKACLDCRKSKRRCVHDEYGRVDPVKASEAPVPRGSATKKRKGDDDASPTNKKMKRESLPSASLAHVGDVFLQTSSAIDPRLQEFSYPQPSIPDTHSSITVSPQTNNTDISTQDGSSTRDLSLQPIDNMVSIDLLSTTPHPDPIISSIEQPPDGSVAIPAWPQDPPQIINGVGSNTPQKPNVDHNHLENMNPASPLSDMAQSPSPGYHQFREVSTIDFINIGATSSQRGHSGLKKSQTPRSPSRGKGATPKPTGITKSRRDSKGTIKVEQKARASSRLLPPAQTEARVETDDEMSARVARELDEEYRRQAHSLRRRS